MTPTRILLRAALCAILGSVAACNSGASGPQGSVATASATAGGAKVMSAQIALSASSYVAAPSSTAIVTIAHTAVSSGSASVSYTTQNGTAQSGVDFTPESGTLTWAEGDTSDKTITVPVAKSASGRLFRVVLTNVSGSASLGSPSSAIVTVAAAGSSSSSSSGGSSSSSSSSSSGGSSSSSSSSSSGGSSSSGTTTPSSATAATSSQFGVRVSGNKLVSLQTGSTVEIIGTNISGLETGMTWRWPSFANAGATFWSQVKNWGGSGVNTVRLPLNEASWLNYTCKDPGSGASGSFYTSNGNGTYTPDPANQYQSTVKKAVADATAAGLYVILDLHWGAPNDANGNALCPIGQPAYADAAHAVTFWKQVADTFKNNPAVMFELFNEPFGSNVYSNWVSGASGAGRDALTLRDGGAYYPYLVQDNRNGAIETYNFTWQVAGMQDLINTIRAEGADNVILSSPIGWAGEIETWLASKPTDPSGQLAVAWHVYGYNKGQSYPLAVLTAGYPIVITETYGLGAIGGYSWTASQKIGYLWWGWNDWGGAQLSSELGTPPWFDSTAP